MSQSVAPYNFVPLAEEIYAAANPPDADRYDAARHTGWFDIEITTLTPVYTRAALGVSKNYARPTETIAASGRCQSADFFHYGDAERTPVLPGSSLRGMVRSIFEIITRSRMEFISDRRYFFRSFAEKGEPFLKNDLQKHYKRAISGNGGSIALERIVGGVIVERNDELVLQVSAATKHGFALLHGAGLAAVLSRGPDLNTVTRVQVAFSDDTHATYGVRKCECLRTGGVPGFLINPGRVVGKPRSRFQVIIEPDEDAWEIPIPDEVYRDYQEWGRMAHGARFGSNKAPRKLGPGSPAFAVLDSDGAVRSVGANMMMPLRYEHGVADLNAKTEHGGAGLDLAQAVFGKTPTRQRGAGETDEERKAVRGRVFFEDAPCETPNPWLPDANGLRTPDILSGPKPTAVQNYIAQPDRNCRGGDLRHWDSPGARIRGFKRYWHMEPGQAEETVSTAPPSGGDTQRTRVRPVRAQSTFRGRVRFENLSDLELGAMHESIRLPDGLAHKIGMGKSLGLGSIRVRVTDVALFDVTSRWRTLDCASERKADAEGVIVAAVKRASGALYPGLRNLWDDERLRDLYAMLSWDQKPDAEMTQYVGPGSADAPDAGSRQWKDRYPLPEPREVDPPRASPPRPAPPPVKPKSPPPPPPRYTDGQKLTVAVTRVDGFKVFVGLPTGEEVRLETPFPKEVGESVRVKLTVGNDGKPKLARPA